MAKTTKEQDTKISKEEEMTKVFREENEEVIAEVLKVFEDVKVGNFGKADRDKIESILKKLKLEATFLEREEDLEVHENTWKVRDIEMFWDCFRGIG